MLNPRNAKEILVGFSGGADSTALLLYLVELYPGKVKAIHFNHQIRQESNEEEAWCEQFCKERTIQFSSYKLDVLKNMKQSEAIEEAARRLRMSCWKKLATASSIIALAHHKDDINENFFIRLMRGSGLRGLTGLKTFTQIDKMTFWRPLLDKSKTELINFLKEHGVTNWCEDESNKKNDYRRNKIRNQLLPLYKEISGGTHSLENSIRVLTEEADFLDQAAESHFKQIKENSSLESWIEVPKALTARVLTYFVEFEKDRHFIPTIATVERFISELQSATHEEKLLPLTTELNLTISKNGVKFTEEVVENSAVTWNPIKTSKVKFQNLQFDSEVITKMEKVTVNCQYFDLEKLTQPLTIRTFQPGDKIKTFSGFTKKLKKVFSDKKVPKSERQNSAILESAGEVIWLAGLTRSNIATVSDSTKQILKISFKTN